MLTMMFVEPPPASAPLVADRVVQLVFLEAVQFSVTLPVFWSVYDWLDGLNGPPCVPEEVSPVAGVTDRFAGALTVNATARVVVPAALVVLVNVTVSE